MPVLQIPAAKGGGVWRPAKHPEVGEKEMDREEKKEDDDNEEEMEGKKRDEEMCAI